MRLAWRVIRLSISDFLDDILWLILFNILLCLAAVTVVALPLVSAGLAWVTAEIGEGKVIGWRTFVAGVRRYWKPAYIWGLMNLVVGGLVAANLFFYLGQEVSWGTIPLMLFAAVGLWWMGMQFYFFPFLVHQETPSIKTAYRNSLVLMLSQPALSTSMFVLVMILTAISYFLVFPLFLLLFTLISVLSNRAVIETVKSQEEAEQERQEAAKKPGARSR
jgi:uncharacterized membrane protein YesL